VILPFLNACLNGTSAVLLCGGLAAIKRGDRKLHERLMYSAFAASSAFLASYLYYHFVIVPKVGITKFNGEGWARNAYYTMLASHVVLAIVNLPLSIRTIYLARRARWQEHKRAAKLTFPIWLYVSVTGVLVYLVLYVWNPAPAA
jgi:uncharacterized membrane protein YozB (DUF420 family)